MASLLLEGGDGKPGFWRELGAAVLSPSTGFNRLVFGDRFDAVFPSRDSAIFTRLRLGGSLTAQLTNEGVSSTVKREEVTADFSAGLPRLEHGRLARHHRPVVARARGGTPGHGPRRHRLRRRRHHRGGQG
jgi:hypothetical protein